MDEIKYHFEYPYNKSVEINGVDYIVDFYKRIGFTLATPPQGYVSGHGTMDLYRPRNCSREFVVAQAFQTHYFFEKEEYALKTLECYGYKHWEIEV